MELFTENAKFNLKFMELFAENSKCNPKFIEVLLQSQIKSYLLKLQIVGNPNRKKMHIFGFVGIFEYICKTTFNIVFNMCTKP